jgi:Domain of unknown function (DUF4158)
VASIERTVYPRFKRAVSDRELHESFTPGLAEIEWARELTRSPEHCLALAVWLKSFQRLGYFLDLFEVPLAVVEHVRGYLGEWEKPWEAVRRATPDQCRRVARRTASHGFSHSPCPGRHVVPAAEPSKARPRRRYIRQGQRRISSACLGCHPPTHQRC